MHKRRWFSGSIVVLLISALLLSGCIKIRKEATVDSFFTDVTAAFRSFDATKIVDLIQLPELDAEEQEIIDEGIEELQEALNYIKPAFEELTVKIVDAPGKEISIIYSKDKKEASVENAALSVAVKIKKDAVSEALKNVWDNLDPEYLEEIFPDGVPTWEEVWEMFKELTEWDEWDGTFEIEQELEPFGLVKVDKKWKLPLEDFLYSEYPNGDNFEFKKIVGTIFTPLLVK